LLRECSIPKINTIFVELSTAANLVFVLLSSSHPKTLSLATFLQECSNQAGANARLKYEGKLNLPIEQPLLEKVLAL